MINLKDLTYGELEKFLGSVGEKPYRAGQIYSWLHSGVESFDEMTNISKDLRVRLEEVSFISKPEVLDKLISKDKTIKILWKLADGETIESVVMEYKHGNSICISTQVGCKMGCKFCASTIGGKIRDLSAGEMLDEVIFAQKVTGRKISNIVLMGIGEPLDNYDNVIKFLSNVGNPKGINIGYRHISLSTCGIVPNIDRLAEEGYPITLSISLHAGDDETRTGIMPVNKKYKIDELINACKRYIEKTGRRISFEYALIAGVNDSEEAAGKLYRLLKGMLCHINLIPVNSVKESTLKRGSEKSIYKFKSMLEKRGLNVTVRRELGSDISASCGQLRRKNQLGEGGECE
ncbi:MAG: 23S rRNA (adenine(2503)-C(2))-methyltransferase RlmN [Bacillota bacterium]|nr:23S rRNA (adenine(2503)-C(2))-methyltransferase RlmN [Bacillota bacterium]